MMLPSLHGELLMQISCAYTARAAIPAVCTHWEVDVELQALFLVAVDDDVIADE